MKRMMKEQTLRGLLERYGERGGDVVEVVMGAVQAYDAKEDDPGPLEDVRYAEREAEDNAEDSCPVYIVLESILSH